MNVLDELHNLKIEYNRIIMLENDDELKNEALELLKEVEDCIKVVSNV